MTPINTTDLAGLLAEKIASKINVSRIILFGSQAYGAPEKASDIDLCFITGNQSGRKIDIMRQIRRELIKFIDIPMDILVYSENEFSERAALECTMEHQISNKGIKIYG